MGSKVASHSEVSSFTVLTPSTNTHDGPPSATKKSLSFILAYTSLAATNFISIMDTVIVATALPAIALDLHSRSNEAYWTGSGFLFAQAVSQPLYGTLSEVFGRKACLMFSMIVFTIASVFCAKAQSMSWLIAARVFQGIGSGGINAVGSIIVTDMVSLRERGKYIGILSLASALGLISGIMMGAGIAGESSWRIIFWINLPLCIPSILGIYFFINLQPPKVSISARLQAVDWLGILILSCSTILLLCGITSGGVLFSWNSPFVITTITLGLLGIIGFIFYEKKYAKNPMIPLRIFANRTSGAAYISSFFLGFCLWAMQYYLILYFLVSQNQSLVGAGVSILPGTILIPISAIVGGIVISKLQRFRTVNSVAWGLMTVGFALMTLLKVDSSKGMKYGFQVVYAVGGGLLFPGRFCAVQTSQLDDDVPMATALVSFITSLGEAFGVGIGGVVFQNTWTKFVASSQTPSQYLLNYHEAERAAELIKPFPELTQLQYKIIMARVIATLFIVLASFSGLAFVVSLGSRNLSMDRESKSSQQFQEKHKDKEQVEI